MSRSALLPTDIIISFPCDTGPLYGEGTITMFGFGGGGKKKGGKTRPSAAEDDFMQVKSADLRV